MITITNGRDTLTVTQGAYKDIFKAQGFIPVSAEAPKMPPSEPDESPRSLPEVTEEDITESKFEQVNDDSESDEENLSEIPLSEMTPDQLKAYATQLGVDIRGIKSKKAVIDRIRSVL